MSSAASEPALIGLDWGTSSLRAFLIAADGGVLDKVSSNDGIMHVADRDFEAVFETLIGAWTDGGGLPVLASGMITSRNGWVETPYENVPAGAPELARALVPHRTARGAELRFVTGVTVKHPAGPDVMRGEEAQIIGASGLGLSDGTFVLPGTHSKWARVSRGRIEDFATYVTGEVFAALKGHTILGTLIEDGPYDAEGFELGVDTGLETGPGLLHDLFSVRTLPLTGRLARHQVADYLSGLLIGAEITGARNRGVADGAVTIVGRSDLADRYRAALERAGIASRTAPDDVVAMGHVLIARAAGLLS